MRRYRAFVHDDHEYLSIGFEDTNDTLLPMPVGWGDRERVVEWVAAVSVAQGAVDALQEIAAADPVDLALDPNWPQRIATEALQTLNPLSARESSR